MIWRDNRGVNAVDPPLKLPHLTALSRVVTKEGLTSLKAVAWPSRSLSRSRSRSRSRAREADAALRERERERERERGSPHTKRRLHDATEALSAA